MNERQDRKGEDHDISPYELDWAAANLPLVRGWASGQRFLYQYLAIAIVLGLAAYSLGYVLAASGAGEPAAFLADLLGNLGVALWTGSVLVLFVQVLPEAQRRSAKRRLEGYEAELRAQGRLEDRRPGDEAAPDDRRT